MDYDKFSRHLREKYHTRFHITDQLADQLEQRWPCKPRNMIQAQREISFPLISYLYNVTCDPSEDRQLRDEPYLNECLLAAERVKNDRCSNRDRRICCENFILAQKLQRIRERPGQHPVKEEKNQRRPLRSKMKYTRCAVDQVSDESMTSAENREDQATVADADHSMECDSSVLLTSSCAESRSQSRLSAGRHFSRCILSRVHNERGVAFKKDILFSVA